MTARATRSSCERRQRGAVLFVSTIILLVLSLLAVAMAKNAVIENKMVASAHNAQLAQLAADSAMSGARARIEQIAARNGAKVVCASLRCITRDAAAPTDPATYMRTPSALAAANPFRIDLAKLGNADATAQLAASPVYVVEDLGAAPSASGSSGAERRLFRITAKGIGATEDFVRVVESVYAVAEEALPAS
ncbi:MAG: pilus assembly protein [Rudaea sp.]|uniref:pilus assembly PilX family protein n=1 Tax=unclassified Rudaea TaxID=2627037 RepID=UPI0010F66DF1|nr:MULTISPECIES: PilX N-terminal domain-containing pilus assembly protein [unclassified Rudaea]MBN8886699.1 pilus assembly protein [Rudaea sp.]MBR0346676.1 pilus assembly protein [Rudaea sp.]